MYNNTPIPSPAPLTTPNGIQIQSAVLPLLTCANGHMGQANVPYHERFALWSDVLIIINYYSYYGPSIVWTKVTAITLLFRDT